MIQGGSGPFWAHFISSNYLPHLKAFRDAVYGRILPGFENADDEAWEHADEVYDSLECRAGPNTDPADIAEKWADAGADRYILLTSVRQTCLNMSTVALRHLLEQQQELLLRRAILPKSQEGKDIGSVRDALVRGLEKVGIYPKSYDSWDELIVLQHAANAIKHGRGRSAEKIRELRPSLLIFPALRDDEFSKRTVEFSRIERPLAGEDLWVTDQDLAGFFNAVESFWDDLIQDFRS